MSETSEDQVKAIGEAVVGAAGQAVTKHMEMRQRLFEIGMALEAAPLPPCLKMPGAEVKAIEYLAACARNDDAVHACRHQDQLEQAEKELNRLRNERTKPATVPQNEAKQVPCCSVCGGLGGTLADADAPVPLHRPALLSDGRPCGGSGQPAAWGAPEQPWAKATLIPSDKPAEAEKRLEALETRLAEIEGRVMARLDRLSEWQNRDARAGADAIEALAGSLKALTARVGDLERHDIANSRIGRLNGEQITALVERVKALEGRAKAETKGRLYRARNEGGAAAAGLPEASRFFESTPYLRRADSNRLALEGAGVRGCWLEVSDDNGQTWKRCEENDNAE